MRLSPLTSLCCTVLLAAPTVALQQPAPASPDVPEAWAIVAEALTYEGWDLTSFEDRLVDLGAAGTSPLFDLLVVGEFELEGQELLLGHEGDLLILAALRRMPTAGLVQRLASMVAPPEPADLRAAQLVLGAVGTSEDFGLLVRLSTPSEADAPVSPPVREGFRDAAWQILLRYREQPALVVRQYDFAPAGLRAPLLDAARRAGMADEVDLFADLLGIHPELDVLLLGLLARAASPWCEDFVAIEAVRMRLSSNDEREQIAAVLALAAFEDGDSVDALIELLPEASPGLAGGIDSALVRITGRDFRGDAERWREWRIEVATWWRTEAQVLLRDLHGMDAARAAAAINELGRHRMYRREFETELLASLDPARPELCALNCAVLARMGSPRVVEHIEALLSSNNEHVSGAAAAALEIISARLHLEFPEPVVANRR